MVGITDSNVKTVVSGAILSLDAAQLRSYPRSGSSWSTLTTASLTATLENGAAFNTVSSSILFDGVDDLATVPFPYVLQDTTIELWFRSTNPSQAYQMLFSIENPSSIFDKNYVLDMNDPNYNEFTPGQNARAMWSLWNGNGTTQYSMISSSIAGSPFADNTWRHYVWTRKSDVKHYMNGDIVTATIFTTGSQTTPIGGTGNYTASIAEWGTVYFPGYINTVRIYDRELSATEIKQNYLADKIRFGL